MTTIGEILDKNNNIRFFRISVGTRNYMGSLEKIKSLREFLDLNVNMHDVVEDNFGEYLVLEAVLEPSVSVEKFRLNEVFKVHIVE